MTEEFSTRYPQAGPAPTPYNRLLRCVCREIQHAPAGCPCIEPFAREELLHGLRVQRIAKTQSRFS